MELWRYYRILRKRKWLILLGTVVCVALVLISLLFTKTQWEAFTTVMERRPEQSGVSIYQEPFTYKLEVQVRLADLAYIASSQTVLDRTAQTLYELGISSAPEEILKTMTVSPAQDTEILILKVSSPSQAEAKATADTLANEFRRFYDELQHGETAKSRRFIEEQLPLARQELLAAQKAVRDFKEANKLVSLDQQSIQMIQRLGQLRDQEVTGQIESLEYQSRVEQLRSQLKGEPSTRTAQEVISENPILQSLKNDMVKAEVELQRLRLVNGKTDEHPEVKAVLGQISKIQEKMSSEKDRIWNSEVKAANPLYETLRDRFANAQVELLSAEAKRAAATQVLGQMQPGMEALPKQEMELAKLMLDQRSAEETYTLLRSKLDEAKIKEQEAANASSIQQIEAARVRKLNPRTGMKLALAVMMGLLLGSGVAFLFEYLDNTVRTPKAAEALLGAPVFAVVPLADRKALMGAKQSPLLDASYQILSTNLSFANKRLGSPTVLVASAEPDVGRSVTVANLAISLAKDGARIIVVDTDLRRPTQHQLFGVENEQGLSNILVGQLSIADAAVPVGEDGLLLIPSGPQPTNPVRLLRTPEMAKFVEEISGMADFVLFDSPSGITFADSAILASLVKNVILVHSAGRVPRGAEAEFRERLEYVEANIIGTVLNRVKPEDSHGYYHFRQAYEDLLVKNGKSTLAVESRALSAIPEHTDAPEESEIDRN